MTDPMRLVRQVVFLPTREIPLQVPRDVPIDCPRGWQIVSVAWTKAPDTATEFAEVTYLAPPADSLDEIDKSLQDWYSVVAVWPETRERYLEHVTAASPRQAEDLVRMTARDKSGELWVAGVFEGRLTAMDVYAQWADDPDKQARTPEDYQ